MSCEHSQAEKRTQCICDNVCFTLAQRLLLWIPKCESAGSPKINEIVDDNIRGDSNTILKLFNWDSGISP